MGILVRRVWKSVGVWGLLMILTIVIPIYVWVFRSAHADPTTVIILVILFGVELVQFTRKLRGYQRPRATESYNDIGPSLLNSTEEFCLVLRPFGADGETLLRQYEFTVTGKARLATRKDFAVENLTIEQVFASAAQEAVQQKLYTLVDQDRRLAPPGMVYMRARNDDWRDAVLALVQRAYAVILWLPPGQEIRSSLSWEIEQIVRAGLQTRTIIVLPPPNEKATYQRGIQQAAILLAAMETAAGKTEQADPLRVQHYVSLLGDRTLTMKFVNTVAGLRLIRQEIPERRHLTWQRAVLNVLLAWVLAWYAFSYFRDRRRNGRVNVLAYELALTSLLGLIRKELAGEPFSSRYRSYGARDVVGDRPADPLGA